MTLFKKLLPLAVLTTIMLGFGVQPAGANLLTLGLPNSGISGYTGPYATVNISLTDSTHAAITFTALDSAGGQHFLMGDGGSVGLNVNGTVTASSITAPQGPQFSSSAPILSLGGAGNEDGFGSFNFTLNNFDGFGYAFRTVSFTLTNTSGTWANDLAVLTANESGYLAAAHIFVANADYTNTNDTGYATNSSVPDGGTTASLLGLALAVGGFLSRRMK